MCVMYNMVVVSCHDVCVVFKGVMWVWFLRVSCGCVFLLQEEVFSSVGRPIIDGCMQGYNGTIFA